MAASDNQHERYGPAAAGSLEQNRGYQDPLVALANVDQRSNGYDEDAEKENDRSTTPPGHVFSQVGTESVDCQGAPSGRRGRIYP